MPTPWVLSLPMWVWRVLMLAWALWLALRVLSWGRWSWACFTEGGLFRSPLVVKRRAEARAAMLAQAAVANVPAGAVTAAGAAPLGSATADASPEASPPREEPPRPSDPSADPERDDEG
jgi:hypothetical protein